MSEIRQYSASEFGAALDPDPESPKRIPESRVRMTMQEAFEKVMQDLEQMSPEQLRAELDKHRNGDIALAFKEIGDFMTDLKDNDPELFAKVTQ